MQDRLLRSPQALARFGGVLYLAIIVIGFIGEVFIRGSIVVPGDATATLENLRSSESLWRAGITANLFLLVCAVPLALIFFVLLRPVSSELALLALLFNVLAIAIEGVGVLRLLEPLVVSGHAEYLRPFESGQLAALAYLPIRSHGHCFGVGLFFFGVECLVLGYLIFRSHFLPKALGVLMQLAGACYLLNSLAMVLSPPLSKRIVPIILIPPALGELSLCLWLLVMGVNVSRWHARVRGEPLESTASGALSRR